MKKHMEDDMDSMEYILESDKPVKVVKAEVDTKSEKIEMNYGQTMMNSKFQHTGKVFKPKGRK